MSSPRPQSTRLENLRLGADGAAFDLDGRSVRLDPEAHAPSLASLQAFHRQALADYYERIALADREPAAMKDKADARGPGWLGRLIARIGQWVGRFIPASGRAPGSSSAPRSPASHPPALSPASVFSEPVHDPAHSSKAAPRLGNRPAREAAAQAAVAAPPFRDAPKRVEAAAPSPTPPVLQSVFADQDGVHLVWRAAAGAAGQPGKGRDKASKDLEFTYGLDSAMAHRLQECYGQLEKLGYKVVGLEVIYPASEKSAAPPEPAKPAPATAIKQIVPEKPAAEPPKPPEPPEPSPRPRKPRPVLPPAEPATAKPGARDINLLPGL